MELAWANLDGDSGRLLEAGVSGTCQKLVRVININLRNSG